MQVEFVLIAAALALAALVLASKYWGWRWASLPAVVILLAATLALPPWPQPVARAPDSVSRPKGLEKRAVPKVSLAEGKAPAEDLADGYVSSRACRECHADQYASWHDSYHRTMTQRATPESVFGDFIEQKVRVGGVI
jgi:hypothetical protein